MSLVIDWQLQKQKEELRKKIIQLEKQLEKKQALELEIEQMRGALKTMKHMDEDEDMDAKKKMNEIKQNLEEKEQEYADVEALNQALVVKERRNNDEVQEARKELVNVCTFDLCCLLLLVHGIYCFLVH